MTCNCHLEKLLGRKPKANIKPIGYPQEGPCEHTIISIFVTTLTLCIILHVRNIAQQLRTWLLFWQLPKSSKQVSYLAVSCPGNSSKQGSEEGSATVSSLVQSYMYQGHIFLFSGSKPLCSMCILSMLILRVFSD